MFYWSKILVLSCERRKRRLASLRTLRGGITPGRMPPASKVIRHGDRPQGIATFYRYAETMHLALPEESQKMWDEMFMIDFYPENEDRFGLDLRKLVAKVTHQGVAGMIGILTL